MLENLQGQESKLGFFQKIDRVRRNEGVGAVFKKIYAKVLRRTAFLGIKKLGIKKEVPPAYQLIEEPPTEEPNKSAIRALKNKYKGKRCFIIGNGPSLNKLDISKLNDEFTFGVNGIFYKTDETGFRPTFYVVEDTMVMKENVKRINAYDVPYKFFPSEYGPLIHNRRNTYLFRMNRGFYEGKSPYFRIPRFSTDCAERIYCGQSVTMMNLQLAFYMGFSEVYLIGMDFSYKVPEASIVEGNRIESTGDDPNHFHPEYFGKGKHWHNPKLDLVLLNYQMAKLVYEATGKKIMNATVGGELELFDRVNFDSLFAS